MCADYTAAIRPLLSVISTLGQLGDNSLITKRFIAYESFLEVKEQAGQERAIGAVGFSRHGFDGETYRKYLAQIEKQKPFSMFLSKTLRPRAFFRR